MTPASKFISRSRYVDMAIVKGAQWALGIVLVLATILVGAETRVEQRYDRAAAKMKYLRPKETPQPANNRMTPERVELGRALFFDPRLSASGLISCGTCHNPSLAWGDGLDRAIGSRMQKLERRTPTILNTAWADSLFWDGRAGSLEEQALVPIAGTDEMNMPVEVAVARVRDFAVYRILFQRAYPGEGVNKDTLSKAIASFERTVVSGSAAFDEWIDGKEASISERAKRGFDLFNTKANCARCHMGWNFTDDGFHDLGIASSDPGHGRFLPQKEDSQHTFKTPTLRNVMQRAPYMHDGSVATLEAVIDLYDKGPTQQRQSISPDFLKLNLSAAERNDLLEFLRTLTSVDRPIEFPILPSK